MTDLPGDLDGFVARVVAERTTDAVPVFYAVAGSHLYGFADPESDVDVRGFHVAPAERYASLDPPRDQVRVNQDGVTDGFASHPDVEVVSYELRAFASQVASGNPNLLDLLSGGERVVDRCPDRVADLAALVGDHLPMGVPASYRGMAHTNHATYLDPDSDRFDPTAKTYLHVVRALLAAIDVQDRHRIEPRIRPLADAVLGDTSIVDDLVAAKRRDPGALLDAELRERADALVTELFERTPEDGDASADAGEFRSAVDDWQWTVRAAVGGD
jgi:predicted nucleotidyltransferase